MDARTNTMDVETMVSLRVGHTTRDTSCRTSRMNLAGFNATTHSHFCCRLIALYFYSTACAAWLDLAGATGFEPVACGFGDRRSTS